MQRLYFFKCKKGYANAFGPSMEKLSSSSNIAPCSSKNRFDNLRFKRPVLG